MAACLSCGTELPDEARFCMACGTPVQAPPALEERRVVTILFVDLVGFTERSDRADPEDVRRTLIPFHARVKDDLERFGGTLDKFIGDAVMGVFGAPVAHEDDPVRAVRAALRILRSMDELRLDDPELAVRIAVNTGEAVVAFGTGPQVGEAVAGDVVNTASRMQSLAPRDSLVVGEATLRALRDRFEVVAMPPTPVKGKAEPLRVWRVARELEGRAPDAAPPAFVGREHELSLLDELFRRAVQVPTIQTVTVIGEPGLGKTRLAAELERLLGARGRRVTGACPPYGEGVTFAPVAETLRALAEVDPSDDPPQVVRRLQRLAERVEHDPVERRWLASRLATVLAVGEAEDGETIPPLEIAEAWARVLGAAAAESPLLLVIEDLQWADPTLVQVVEAVADRLYGRPVLLLVTARPDLLERHERWGVGRIEATTIALRPLRPEETDGLVASLLEQTDLPSSVRSSLLERAGGNPLYAIQFVRMLGDRFRGASESLETPETVQAVIAARLDAIPPELRALVQDAAVLGEEFWPEALAALGKRAEAEVRGAMAALVRRGVVEPRLGSSLGGQAYGFAHSLFREVAYGRLPRTERARRHLAAAEWIEVTAGERAQEHAEALARHFAAAVELGATARERDVVDRALGRARGWSMTAADRAARIDPAGAFALYDRALAMTPEGSRERFQALASSARAGRRGGVLDAQAVLTRYEQALAIARELDDPVLAGEALTRIGSQLGALGQTARARDALTEAVATLEAEPPGPSLARAYAYRAEDEMFGGHVSESRQLADRALELLADQSGELVVMALHIRGDARCSLGDAGGLEDLREALRLSQESQNAFDIVTSLDYLAEWRWAMEGPAAALSDYEAAFEIADRRGIVSQGLYAKTGAAAALFASGDWDRALRFCDELLATPGERLDPSLLVQGQAVRSHIMLARGRPQEAFGREELVRLARQVEELHAIAPALVAAAEIATTQGEPDAAVAYLEEFEEVTSGVAPEYRGAELAHAVRICLQAGEARLAERLVEGSEPRTLRDRLQEAAARAMLAETRGEEGTAAAYGEVAARWRTYGNPFEEAMALLGRARCLEADGASEAGGPDRREASELLARLGVPG